VSEPTPQDIARAHAALLGEGSFEQRIGQLLADERDWSARVCDDVASGDSRTATEKAVARMLAERIRSGRL